MGTGTHCVRRDESLSNGSNSIGLLALSKSTIPMADEEEGEEEEEEEEAADKSQVPLLSIQGDVDVTLLSQATEITCLSSMDYSMQNPRQNQRRPHRRRSLHSHDSSLHSSLDSSGGGSSQSLRGHEDNDNNTGISRNVDHQMNDSGLVVTTAGSADGAPSGSSELVHT